MRLSGPFSLTVIDVLSSQNIVTSHSMHFYENFQPIKSKPPLIKFFLDTIFVKKGTLNIPWALLSP